MMHIHTNIKVLREEARLTQEEFAERIGESLETVQLWEKGKAVPTDAQIEVMCPVLRIHVEDFLERDILSERRDSGRRMKKSDTRRDYNWYLGDRRVMLLYGTYLILIPLLIALSYIASSMVYNAFKEYYETTSIVTQNRIFLLFSLISCGVVSGIYLLIYIIKYRIVQFQFYYIFWLSTIFIVLAAASIISVPILYGYSFYKVVIKRGKNR